MEIGNYHEYELGVQMI
ncbi:hypothetical protein [Mesobacillus boroniphilus]